PRLIVGGPSNEFSGAAQSWGNARFKSAYPFVNSSMAFTPASGIEAWTDFPRASHSVQAVPLWVYTTVRSVGSPTNTRSVFTFFAQVFAPIWSASSSARPAKPTVTFNWDRSTVASAHNMAAIDPLVSLAPRP